MGTSFCYFCGWLPQNEMSSSRIEFMILKRLVHNAKDSSLAETLTDVF